MPNAMIIREETPLFEMGITRHLALTQSKGTMDGPD
jgi:hypothetical protein